MDADPSLFDNDAPHDWRAEWEGMPEFVQGKQEPHQQIIVRFRTAADVEAFAVLLGQRVTPLTKSLWYPALARGATTGQHYVTGEP